MSVTARVALLLALVLVDAAARAEEGCADRQCPAGVEVEFGRYGAGVWHAARMPAINDGELSCVAFARAANAEPGRGLWLYVFSNSLRFGPDQPLPDDEYVNINTGQVTMPLAVGRGNAFAPLTYPLLARAVGDAETVIIHVGVRRPPDDQEFLVFPMDGFRAAYGRIAEECAFDPTPVLGNG